MDLSKLLLTTDTDTLKNDGSATGGFTMSASQSISSGNRYMLTTTVDVGQAGSSVLGYFTNSKEGAKTFGIGVGCALQRTGTVGGSPFSYTLYVTMERTGATSVTFRAFAINPYGSTLTTASGAETFTFLAKTIVEPF